MAPVSSSHENEPSSDVPSEVERLDLKDEPSRVVRLGEAESIPDEVLASGIVPVMTPRDFAVPLDAVPVADEDDATTPLADEVTRLRQLLQVDRRDCGEARPDAEPVAPLQTMDYVPPVALRWRRFWRERRQFALAAMAACLTAFLAVVLAQSSLFSALRARVSEFANKAEPKAPSSAETVSPPESAVVAAALEQPAAPIQDAPIQNAPAAAIVAEPAPVAPEKQDAPVAKREAVGASLPSVLYAMPKNEETAAALASLGRMSIRQRLGRADALLLHGSPRSTLMSRAILESTLPEVPQDAHSRATLASACLLLNDEACAREAIAQALRLRPRRARYRALSNHIETVFSQASEGAVAAATSGR
jgi:hypothetical protein